MSSFADIVLPAVARLNLNGRLARERATSLLVLVGLVTTTLAVLIAIGPPPRASSSWS